MWWRAALGLRVLLIAYGHVHDGMYTLQYTGSRLDNLDGWMDSYEEQYQLEKNY